MDIQIRYKVVDMRLSVQETSHCDGVGVEEVGGERFGLEMENMNKKRGTSKERLKRKTCR